MLKKKMKDKKVIDIKEEVQIGDIILEKGDKIKILKEDFTDSYSNIYNNLNQFRQTLLNVWFSMKDNTVFFGDPSDSSNFMLIEVTKDSLTFKDIKDKKELKFDYLFGNVTIFNIENSGFKLENDNLILNVME